MVQKIFSLNHLRGALFLGLLCLILSPQVSAHRITDSGSLFEAESRGDIHQQKSFFNSSIFLAASIFENFYCGNVDGFPHFKQFTNSTCVDKLTGQIADRDFWTDGTSVSSFFVMYERYIQSVQQTNSSSSFNNTSALREIMSRLTTDWNLTKMRDLLLWDKLNKTDVYGVGNDDRLWYAIAFLQIHNYQEQQKNQSQDQGKYLRRFFRFQKRNAQQIEEAETITFLSLCQEIFWYVAETQENSQCNGGVFWDQDRSYKNSITNHLFEDLASKLFVITGEQLYLMVAEVTAQWEIDKGLVDEKLDWLFYDGLLLTNEQCSDIQKDKWTYNQGVFLEPFLVIAENTFNNNKLKEIVENNILSIITPKTSNNMTSNNTNSSSRMLQFYPYSNLSSFVVLQEYKNWNYTETTATFKGIYFRYLGAAFTMFEKYSQHNYSQIHQLAASLISEIHTYVLNNYIYVKSLANDQNLFPFFWDDEVSSENQVFSAGSSIAVLDLFAFSDYIRAREGQHDG